VTCLGAEGRKSVPIKVVGLSYRHRVSDKGHFCTGAGGDSTSSSVEFTSTAVEVCAVTRADNSEHTAVEFNMKMSGIRIGTK